MRNKEPTVFCFLAVRMSSLPLVKQQCGREKKTRRVRRVNSKNGVSHLSKSRFHDVYGLSYFLSDGGWKKETIHIQHMLLPKGNFRHTHKYCGVERSGWPTVQCPTNIPQCGCGLSLQGATLAYSYRQCEDWQTGFMIPPFPSSGAAEITSNWFKNFQILL